MKRLFCSMFLISGIACGGPSNGCALIPQSQVAPVLGTTKNTSIDTQLPPKATEGRACNYVGQENIANVVLMKFESAEAAREYMASFRARIEKKAIKMTPEKFDEGDGLSYPGGIVVVRKNAFLRVTVRPRIPTEHGGANPSLTRELLLAALRAN